MTAQWIFPEWLKPPTWSEHRGSAENLRHELAPAAARPIFLHEVSQWDVRWQRILFQVLIPVPLLIEYHIDPVMLTDPQGRPVVFRRLGADQGSFRLELFHSGAALDPMAEIELVDTIFNQIEVVWVALQDPTGPRFDIDVTPAGESTMRGTAARNIAAEEAAMAAGLAPGQIRRGLRSLHWLVERMETLLLCLNQREYVVQPLFYHTAVLFEQFGFSYIQGQQRMVDIAAGFQPGGDLCTKLDGSTPFRKPEGAATLRGRSWAIHDGILDGGWDRMRMIKRLGISAGVCTCPGVPW